MLDWLRHRRPAGEGFRQAYESFRRLLGRNAELLSLMADLEVDLHCEGPADARVQERIRQILATSRDLVQDVSELTGGGAQDLFAAHQRLHEQIRAQLAAAANAAPPRLCLDLADREARARERAGGKAANLAALAVVLPDAVPPGFVATTAAYRQLCVAAGLPDRLRRLWGSGAAIADHAAELRRALEETPVPVAVEAALREAARAFPAARRWAVRSSSIGEDGAVSFAGQFDSLLGVPPEELPAAFRAVAASRFSDRALAYGAGVEGAPETPMAVLFLPMIAARAAGVLYTRDPHDAEAPTMWLSSAFGLGPDVVGGRAPADLFILSRAPVGEIVERRVAAKETALALRADAAGIAPVPLPEAERAAPSLDDDAIRRIAELGLAAERHFGAPQDLEWAQDRAGQVWLLQSRPLAFGRRAPRRRPVTGFPVRLRARPLAPGRAVGPVRLAGTLAAIEAAPEGAILVVHQATPELTRALGRVAAVIAEAGSAQSHAAALLRQARVPAVSDAADAFAALGDGDVVGVDGTNGEVYAGVPWPELRRRPRAAAGPPPPGGFVQDLVLRLTLVDAGAAALRPSSCASVHDVVRLVHERALEAMFRLGDRYARGLGRVTRRLESAIPLDLEILDLGDGIAPGAVTRRRVSPDQIVSTPFRALWRGIVDPRVSWSGRRTVDPAGFFSVVQHTVLQELGAMRRLGERNYLVVAPEYVNLNARLAYHFTMLDAVVGDAPDNNSISFRFAGGGAGRDRRDLRARFLAQVLGALGFGVDRRGDLVNAWLRAASRAASEAALAHLGRLMACARQLDMLLGDEEALRTYTRSFLAEDYGRFA